MHATLKMSLCLCRYRSQWTVQQLTIHEQLDKDHRPELWLNVLVSVDHVAYFKKSTCRHSAYIVWACVLHMCESLKFEGRSTVAMALWWLLADLADWCSSILSTEFAVFVLCTKHTMAIYCGKAYSLHNNLKMMAGGHAVHEQQTISSTTVLITPTFCIENEKHLTPEG